MAYLGRNPAVGTQRMLDSLELQFNGTLTTFDLRYGGVPIYPTLSESLIVSLGGVLQEPGEAFYVSSDRIVFSEAPPAGAECWILLYSQYGASVGSSTSSPVIQATGEPMGFENRTHSSISFDNATRTFSIAPNTTGGHSSYVIWTKGTRRVVSTTQSVQVGTSTGLYYIYFDANGDIQYKTTYFTWDTETMVAYVYWNSGTSSAPFIADERHGVVLDWQTHEYLHRTRGAVIAEGFSISAYTTTGNGNVDAHAKFDMGNGTFFDEDLEVNITHSASPIVGTFTQVLTGGAEIPVFYMSGSAGAWVRDSATKYACKQSATTLQYNLLSGSTWSTTPASDNRYVVSWIVATNDITAPVICILGQDQYTAIGTAEEAKFGELVLTNFPIVEFRPLWKVIFQTSTGFTNVPNALIANVLDLRHYSESSISGTIISDHGLLSGLADDDHSQYIHTTLTRTGVTAEFNTTGKITTTNNVGIGTTNPVRPLDLLSSTNNNSIGLKNSDTGSGIFDGFSLQSSGLNVGLHNFEAGHIYFATSDAERARIDSSGRLLVGTSSTSGNIAGNDKLAVVITGEGTQGGISITEYAGVSATVGSYAALRLQRSIGSTDGSFTALTASNWGLGRIEFNGSNGVGFGTGATIEAFSSSLAWGNGDHPASLVFSTTADGASTPTERMRITSAGLVGVGINAPQSTIDILSGVRGVPETSGSTTSVTTLRLRGASNGVLDIGELSSATAGSYWLQVRDRTDLAFTYNLALQLNGGNVGIGVTSPAAKLHVDDGTGCALYVGLSSNIYYRAFEHIFQGQNGTNERLRITSAGNVGIGTTNPSTILSIGAFASSSFGGGVCLNRGPSVYNFYEASDGTNSVIFGLDHTLAVAKIGSVNSYPIGFFTNNAERARIDSSGRLLVGTSSARVNYFGAGHIGSNLQVVGSSHAESSVIIHNQANNTQGSYLQLGKSRGTGYQILDVTDPLGFISFQGADGTVMREGASVCAYIDGTPGPGDMPSRLVFSTTAAGSSFSTERMRITSAGNIGIGSTNPTSKLDVVGTVTATNFADATGGYNVNLGSGGSEGRGVVAGYSGGSYGGIGYNVRHTTSGGTYISPIADYSNYLVFNAGFTFLGDGGGAAGRTTSFSTLARLDSSGNLTQYVGGSHHRVAYASNSDNYSSTLWWNGLALGNNGDNFIVAGRTATGGSLKFYVNNTSDIKTNTTPGGTLALTLASSGSATFGSTVGIGIAPISPLTIAAASTQDNAVYQSWVYSPGNENAYRLDLKQTVTSNVVRYNFSMINNGTSYTDVLVLDRGNVGIGTTNPSSKLDVVGSITASGSVSAAGTSGFYSTTFVTNARNPIWRFANADGYGLSYFQGTSGVSPAGGGDTIGFHFGTATAAASILQLNSASGAVVNGTLSASSGLRTLEQVRATGWWGVPTGSSYSGLGVEMGVSGGHGYILCYNRDNSTWGNLRIQGGAGSTTIELPSSGSTINVTGNIDASGIVRAGGGRLVLRDDSLENHATDTDTASVVVNYAGYASGYTRFRDFHLYNGKTGLILKAVGSSGNVGIGTTNPTFKLEVNGSFAATTKSFLIPHPTKEGYRLRHGSLEGPENGVYVRGRGDSTVIELPEYWTGLVDSDSITVNLTPIGQNSPLWVERIEDNKVYVGREDTSVSYFYTIFAERIDVPALDVEIKIEEEDE